jgi:hypothetical protein
MDCREFDVSKRALFLIAVLLSFSRWVLADDVSYIQGGLVVGNSAGAVALLDLSRANSLNGTLMSSGITAGHFTIPGNGQSAWESVLEEKFDASSRTGFSSIVQAEDGIISISVPEPETMGTIAIGLAMIAGLISLKDSKSKCFLH